MFNLLGICALSAAFAGKVSSFVLLVKAEISLKKEENKIKVCNLNCLNEKNPFFHN